MQAFFSKLKDQNFKTQPNQNSIFRKIKVPVLPEKQPKKSLD